MDRWMDACMHAWMGGVEQMLMVIVGCVYGQVDRRINGWIEGWVNGWMDAVR